MRGCIAWANAPGAVRPGPAAAALPPVLDVRATLDGRDVEPVAIRREVHALTVPEDAQQGQRLGMHVGPIRVCSRGRCYAVCAA